MKSKMPWAALLLWCSSLAHAAAAFGVVVHQQQRNCIVPTTDVQARSSTASRRTRPCSQLHASMSLLETAPAANPNADLTRRSSSGVRYETVSQGLDVIIPPAETEKRNAISRTDGYWPHISAGEEAPIELTYGEFDFYFFANLLERAVELQQPSSSSNKVFCDVGSGVGRLVFAAAALHPKWKKCKGIEILPGLHNQAESNLDKCNLDKCSSRSGNDNQSSHQLPGGVELAPISFTHGSFEDQGYSFGDSDIIFTFGSCLPEHVLASLRDCVLKQCKQGTIIITTDYILPGCDDSTDISVIEKIDGYNWATGGESSAYMHRYGEAMPSNQSPAQEAGLHRSLLFPLYPM